VYVLNLMGKTRLSFGLESHYRLTKANWPEGWDSVGFCNVSLHDQDALNPADPQLRCCADCQHAEWGLVSFDCPPPPKKEVLSEL
jgi:hypothetical protein